jgi:glyoxylase-like metal-dependent hydrolase (beta-lactamase superfamily II)
MEATGWPEALPRPGNRKLRRLESTASWFEVLEVGPGTFALLEPLHSEEVISYLILGSERAVLFDTGMGIGNIQAEVERLSDLPLVVVNSHSHYDHVGDDHRFGEVWAFDDDFEVSRIEEGLSRAQCAHYLPPDSYLKLPPGFDPATYEIRPSPVARRLHHRDRIELGGRTLTVHHTPGHSPGSLCLLDSRDGLLFSGDTFYPGMLYAHLVGSDFGDYVRSIQYLESLLDEVSQLCPAHNEATVSKEILRRVTVAFERIAAGRAEFNVEGETRIYRFDGFGLALPSSAAQDRDPAGQEPRE